MNPFSTQQSVAKRCDVLTNQTKNESMSVIEKGIDTASLDCAASTLIGRLLKKSVSALVVFSYLSLTIGQSYAMESNKVVPFSIEDGASNTSSTTSFCDRLSSFGEDVFDRVSDLSCLRRETKVQPENKEKQVQGLKAVEKIFDTLFFVEEASEEAVVESTQTSGAGVQQKFEKMAAWSKERLGDAYMYAEREAFVARDGLIWSGLTVANTALWTKARARTLYDAEAEMPGASAYYNTNEIYYADQSYYGGHKDDYMLSLLTLCGSGALALSLVAETKFLSFTVFNALATMQYFYEKFYYYGSDPYEKQNQFIEAMTYYTAFGLSWFLMYKVGAFINTFRPTAEEQFVKERYSRPVEYGKKALTASFAVSAGSFAYSQYFLNAYGLHDTDQINRADLTYLPVMLGLSTLVLAWVVNEPVVNQQTRSVVRTIYGDKAQSARERLQQAWDYYVDNTVKNAQNQSDIKKADVVPVTDIEGQVHVKTAEAVERELAETSLKDLLRKAYIDSGMIKVGSVAKDRRKGINVKAISGLQNAPNRQLSADSDDAVQSSTESRERSEDGKNDDIEKGAAAHVVTDKAAEELRAALAAHIDSRSSYTAYVTDLLNQGAQGVRKAVAWAVKHPQWVIAAALSVPVYFLSSQAFMDNANVAFSGDLTTYFELVRQSQFKLQYGILKSHEDEIRRDPSKWLSQCFGPDSFRLVSNKTVVPHEIVQSDVDTITTAGVVQDVLDNDYLYTRLNTTRSATVYSPDLRDYVISEIGGIESYNRVLSNGTDDGAVQNGWAVDDDFAAYYYQEMGYFPPYILHFNTIRCLGIESESNWYSTPNGLAISDDNALEWLDVFINGYAYLGGIPLPANGNATVDVPQQTFSVLGNKVAKGLSIPYAIGAYVRSIAGTAGTFDQIVTSGGIANAVVSSINGVQGFVAAAPFIVATFLTLDMSLNPQDAPWKWAMLAAVAFTSTLSFVPAYRQATKKTWRYVLDAAFGPNVHEDLMIKTDDIRIMFDEMDPSIAMALDKQAEQG